MKKTILSEGEKKIDFLIRYVPKLRNASRTMIEELEVFFIKQVYTLGFLIQKQDEQDDYLYFIFRGRCHILLATGTKDHQQKAIFSEDIQSAKKQLVLGTLKTGDCFGEHSALNDLKNPYSIEAASPKVIVYTILRNHFIHYFGGL